MITINNTEYRNLEEQVLKNKQDIAQHYQAMQLPLNLAGITVVGTITDPSELDYVSGHAYGEAYVQVVGDDTHLWIWSRANENAGHPTDYWINIPFTTVGPQGPQGEQGFTGPQGPRGTKWWVGTVQPTYNNSAYGTGDIYLNSTNGNVWVLEAKGTTKQWVLQGNIRGIQGPTGPQGPQGPQGQRGSTGAQGPRGQAGAAVLIGGILSSVSQLPSITSLSNLNIAYLVGAAAPYQLWIQVGTNVNNAVWTNVGEFGTGTTVFVNSEAVPTFDADTKLDMPERILNYDAIPRIYADTREVQYLPVQTSPEDGAIPRWTENDCLRTGNPVNDDDAVNWRTLYERMIQTIGHAVLIELTDTRDDSLRTLIYKQINNMDEPICGIDPIGRFDFMTWIIGQPLIDENTLDIVQIAEVTRDPDDDELFRVKLKGDIGFEYQIYFDSINENYYFIYEP